MICKINTFLLPLCNNNTLVTRPLNQKIGGSMDGPLFFYISAEQGQRENRKRKEGRTERKKKRVLHKSCNNSWELGAGRWEMGDGRV